MKEAQNHKHVIHGPINWADLHCYESRYIMTDGGDEYFEVIIREAYHSNQQLCDFVKERIVSEYDYHLVYPVFEW